MRKSFTKLALAASIALALTFTFGCSSDDNSGGGGSGGSGNGGNILGGSSSSRTQNPSSSGRSSSSSRTNSSSSEYTGGSCNVSDYGTVNIGGQIWMAKNWSCYAPSSKCYNNEPANCDTYGRLYDWATAMSFPSKCNSVLSTSDADCAIKTPNHRGICPTGWHIPTYVEWDELLLYVDLENGGDGSGTPYDSYTAGKYLKAEAGWYKDGNGTDKYGFAALPGGIGFGSSFYDVGRVSYWLSASESKEESTHYSGIYHVYCRDMGWQNEEVYAEFGIKSQLLSVRCLKD